MRRFLALATVGALALPALADEMALGVDSFSTAHYSASTGEVTTDGATQRYGPATAWDSTTSTGFFSNRISSQWVVDWGDVANNTLVNGFQLGYATNSNVPVNITVSFYAPGDGHGDASTLLASYLIPGLPGTTTPGTITGWTVDVDLEGGFEFLLSGADLDGDGLTDFEYEYNMTNRGDATSMGPLISTGGVGQEDAFDRYDNNSQAGGGTYAGTFWFGGNPYAQFHMRLYTVPEPASLALLAIGALSYLRRR